MGGRARISGRESTDNNCVIIYGIGMLMACDYKGGGRLEKSQDLMT